MQLTGEHTFDAPRQVVWDFLMDPAVLEACLPGAEGMTEVGPDEYTATMKAGTGLWVRNARAGHAGRTDDRALHR
jgi:carbon monoxide dehydrogenase subunit G